MRRSGPLGAVIAPLMAAALVLAGCTGSGEDQGEAPPATVTATATETEAASPTPSPSTTPSPPPAPPRTQTQTVTPPPAAPAPQGGAGLCAYDVSWPTLSPGSGDVAAVQQAQCYLNAALTGEDIPVDGDFGPVTEAAVKRFQSCAGLTVDGVVGPDETWPTLAAYAEAGVPVC